MEARGDVAIELKNVSKTFSVWEKQGDTIRGKLTNLFQGNNRRQIKALSDISFQVRKGELFGIVGRNGSGKSTLLKLLIGLYPPDRSGTVRVRGKVIRLALGIGFDPDLTARENIYLNASLLGLSFKHIGSIFDRIIEFAELEKFVDTKIRVYSSGMRSRLAFSIAAQVKTDVFLIDEFFGGVGDINFHEKSERVFRESVLDGKTIVMVSHNLNIIKKHCDRVMVLDNGRNVGIGDPKDMIEVYKQLMKQKR